MVVINCGVGQMLRWIDGESFRWAKVRASKSEVYVRPKWDAMELILKR